ncbi:sugar phosphate isomerase/epimerase family protein [Nonomuraea sp. NPDC049400]|uniref:sugar phosphate isomerase/epimerase family protein n=1 Tax=Nonomuraea sp. NPDC049400 TaxID=3364352 RepID=UPI0037966474
MTSAYAITLCAMTLRRASFTERLQAAAEGGFDAIGLTLDQYQAAREGRDDVSLRRLLAAHGLRVAEVETSWDWAADGPDRDDEGRLLFHVLETFGCDQLNVVQFAAHPHERLVGRLAALCERAAVQGVRIALEYMPFSEIRTLPHAWRLVRETQAPNAGLLLDSWHHHRSGGSPGDLADIPPERVLSVQLNDTRPTAHDDLRYEARHLRLPPGARATAFARELRTLGVTARMSAEVWSDELELLPPAQAARLVHDATAGALAAAGWPLPHQHDHHKESA